MKRCTKTFLESESDNTNRKALIEILPYFHLDDWSEHAAKKAIQREDGYRVLQDIFHFDNQQRAWYELARDCYANDELYRLYIKMLNRAYCSEKISAPDYNDVSSMSHFVQGRTAKGEKLFKYLLKNNVLTQTEVDELNNLRTSSKQAFLCVSQNPIDMLMASTNQSFTSCISLASEYSAAYYMGFPDCWTDKNRMIVFVTHGKFVRHTIKDYTFKHFRYIQRSWMINTKQGMVLYGAYPSDNYPVRDMLTSIGMKFTNSHSLYSRVQERLRLSFRLIGDQVRIYDDCGLDEHMQCFNHSGGFEGLPYDNIDAITNGTYPCVNCGRFETDYNMRVVENEYFCDDCFSDIFTYCDKCDRVIVHEDGYVFQTSFYCEECYNEYVTSCYECGGDILIDDALCDIHDHDYCESCFSEHCVPCDECNDNIRREDAIFESDLAYCADCYAALFFECSECGGDFSVDELKEYEGAQLCAECFNDMQHTNCEICGERLLTSDALEREDTIICAFCESGIFGSEVCHA